MCARPVFVGVDPDMHDLNFVKIDTAGKFLDLCQLKVPSKRFKGREALIEMIRCLTLSRDLRDFLIKDHILAVAVESQEIYQHGQSKTQSPRSIMQLATVAGAAITRAGMPSNFEQHKDGVVSFFPAPQAWKGSVPKQIHQARVLHRMGWRFETHGSKEDGYCVPQFGSEDKMPLLRGPEWKHITDSLGLALYAMDEFTALAQRQKRLTSLDSKG